MITIKTTEPNWEKTLMEYLPEYGKINVSAVNNSGDKIKFRIAKAKGGGIIRMHNGSKKYGWYLDKSDFSEIYIPDKKEISEEEKWRKSWEKVLERLNKSGFYKDYRKDLETVLSIGYEKFMKVKKICSENYLTRNEKETVEKVRSIDPIFIRVREDGSEYVHEFYEFYHPAKIKKMYFGKYGKNILDELSKAIENKLEFQAYRTVGYDVSVHYSPEHNRVWYSEEYRNCGNGHYYLGLDATHAVFYEDD